MSDRRKLKKIMTDDDLIALPRVSRRAFIAGAGGVLGAAALGVRGALAEDEGGQGGQILTGEGEKQLGDMSDDDKDESKKDVDDNGAEMLTDEGIKIEE